MSKNDTKEKPMIKIRGCRTHNLKNIDIDIPRNELVVITGVSGSGKSSLAFDTLYAEGQRRYVESLSAYARQFLSIMDKPDVDHIEGLSPAIAIDQKSTSHNPRSTVGTITEIYDYLRLLYARVGDPICPTHNTSLSAQTISQMVDHTMTLPEQTAIMLLAPIIQNRKGSHQVIIEQLRKQGFVRVLLNNEIYDIDQLPPLAPNKKNDLSVVVDRCKIKPGIESRLADSLETTLGIADGIAIIAPYQHQDFTPVTFSAQHACPHCGFSISELEPRLFSFNNPTGACQTCDGLGVDHCIDINKLIPHPDHNLSAGAITGWNRNHPYYFQHLEALAKHHDFCLKTPWNQLDPSIQKAILYGSKASINFEFTGMQGRHQVHKKPFPGVIAVIEKRFHDTSNNEIRDALAPLFSTVPCQACNGSRLNQQARAVFIGNTSLPTVTAMTISDTQDFFTHCQFSGAKAQVADRILKEIQDRLGFLIDVGLNYLTLSRQASTLSGGEGQRIRLASQIGSGLVGVMYILDEPSIGLHARDNDRLIATLQRLRDLGNTVLVVEHDEKTMETADHIIDVGPAAGEHGGEIITSGTFEEIKNNKNSLTADYLTGRKFIAIPHQRINNTCKQQIIISECTVHNLKNITVRFPIGLMTCVTGVSGSGKSSLINDTLYPLARAHLSRNITMPANLPAASITGLEHIDKVIDINQDPIGRTPRSNPATYTGMLTPIRELFSQTPMARARGYKAGRFSFNVAGGRCSACDGAGLVTVEMHFLANMYVPCDVCHGQRYNRETLEIKYKQKNISEVLKMTVSEALDFFQAIPTVRKKCETLQSVGLDYIRLGQAATTLSGGEAQRVRLAKELSKRDTGRTLYLLDEPTTGLHFHDIAQLLKVITQLRDCGNTLIIVEHNLDVIKVADWVIDMGPEGGEAGGNVMVSGTPETVADCAESHTGQFLKTTLKQTNK